MDGRGDHAPSVAPLTAAGVPGSPCGPSLPDRGRAFTPTAALTARDRGVLVFQVKRKGSSQFRPTTPVRAGAFGADGSVGPLQTLTPAPAIEPAVLPIAGGRALALWAGTHRLGAPLAEPDGCFHSTATRPPRSEHRPSPATSTRPTATCAQQAAMRSSHGKTTVSCGSAFAASERARRDTAAAVVQADGSSTLRSRPALPLLVDQQYSRRHRRRFACRSDVRDEGPLK